MEIRNGFFKVSDPAADEIGGFEIDPRWWSRRYEYPWALQFARPGDTCADMGCGWMGRPLKDALAKICAKVYAVDERESEVELVTNIEWVTADFTREIAEIPAGSLDRIYCISVLEDVPNRRDALVEFRRLLAPKGRIVLSFDVLYDPKRTDGNYPGIQVDEMILDAAAARLRLVGFTSFDQEGALVNQDFNLCVFHCVLEAGK